MVEIIAYTQDTDNDQVVLDLYGDEVIPIKFNIESIVNPDKLSTSYSKQFDLPATKKNNRFFKAYYDVTSEGNFNPYKKVDVIIRSESIELFKGIMQVYSITHKGGLSTYTVNIFSSIINLYDEIRDLTLNDIDFSDLTHFYTIDNIAALSTQSSINNISGSAIPTKVLYYPWCNWGYVYDGSTSNNIVDVPPNMQAAFRPWIRIKYILDKIFEGSSFTFSSTFLSDPEFTQLYMDTNWGDDTTFIIDDLGYAAESKIGANVTPTTSFVTLVYDNEFSDTYDIYNNSTGVFTAPNDNCKLEIDTRTRFEWYSSSDEITIRLEHNSTHPLAPASPIDVIEVPAAGASFPYEDSETNIFQDIYLNNGETCTIKVKKSSGTHASTRIKYNIGASGATNATRFVMGLVSGHVQDIQSNLRANHGNIKQLDFLKDIIKRFNLVLIPDEANANNLLIEPYVNWIDDGSTLDWSNKVDNEEYKIEVPDNYRRFKLSDALDDSDIHLNKHNEVYGYPHGSHIKNNTDVELYDRYEYDFSEGVFSSTVYKPFSTGTTTNSILSPYYPEDFPIPHIYGEDFSKIASKPRIGYYAGRKDVSTTSSQDAIEMGSVYSAGFNNNAVNGTIGSNALMNSSGEFIKIPTISPYYDDSINQGVLYPGLPNEPIDYGVIDWYYLSPGASLPENTIYKRYWHRYLNERYNKDVKILKINADLNSADIHQLEFNDDILIKGQKYYLLSVEHYPNTDKLTKLELIKINNQIDDACPAVANISPFTGLVTDSSNNSLSAYCCSLAGYVFTGGGCYANVLGNNNGSIGLNMATTNMMMPAAQAINTNTFRSGSNLLTGGNNNLFQAKMNLVAGADNNLSNAFRSAAIGADHEISTDHAAAIGMGAIAERHGELAHGYSSTRGRAQCSQLIFTGRTTDGNYTEIFIDGDSSKKFTVDQVNDSFIGIEANVLAHRPSNQHSMHKYQHTTFRVQGGGYEPVQVGNTSTKTNNKDTDVSSWNNRFTAGSDYIKVEVKGETGATIDWTVILYINEMRT